MLFITCLIGTLTFSTPSTYNAMGLFDGLKQMGAGLKQGFDTHVAPVFGIDTPQSEAKARVQAHLDATPDIDTSAPTNTYVVGGAEDPSIDNVQRAYEYYTSDQAVEDSGGLLKAPMTPEGASGLLGNYVVETGDPTLKNLDVVEKNAKKGRGMGQYTGARREAYDKWRNTALAEGRNPNSMSEQLKYSMQEFGGDHDLRPGYSLAGYTNSLNELGGMSAEQTARHLRRDYFRPSEPHEDRRVKAALDIYSRFNP